MLSRPVAAPSHPLLARADAPTGVLAIHLLELWSQSQRDGLLYIAASERAAEHLASCLHALEPDAQVLVFPRWDCLPYDTATPSRDIMGRRASVLRRLALPSRGAPLVLATPDAVLQRVPPRGAWNDAIREIRRGDTVDLDELATFFARTGYVLDERVDEPGEAAIRGQVIDIYPGGALGPVRLEHDEGRITALHAFEPASQRTLAELDEVILDAASEAILPVAGSDDVLQRPQGLELRLGEHYGTLETVFDYLPLAAIALDPEAIARAEAWLVQIEASRASRIELRTLGAPASDIASTSGPERLYLTKQEWDARIAGAQWLPSEFTAERVPSFARERDPARRFREFVRAQLVAGHRVLLTAASERDLRVLAARAGRLAPEPPVAAPDWDAVAQGRASALLTLLVDFEAGFVLPERGLTVVAAADLLGSRAARGAHMGTAPTAQLGAPETFQHGDVVVHWEHGIGRLDGIETVPAPGLAENDTVRLTYANDAKLMVPVGELAAIWRYGSGEATLALDRLDGETWPKRRAKVEAEVRETAERLVEIAREKRALSAPKLVPPQQIYERFVARFPYLETPDQARAIAETLDDLGSGQRMDRLVCGDVGFGKTEVALRAAAAAAFAGFQVALVVPTTVLARQHVETFRRRFAGFDVQIGHLSRLVSAAEARAVKKGLANGEISIAIGTHALAGKGVRFENLGLLIVDEEQRFGAAQKAKLRTLGEGAHVLSLTATPIPRTLQSAMVGLQALSIIATPPSRRVPVRTLLAAFDAATVREALLYERRRGGQSFVVCPRIEDIEPMAARLRELAPELDVSIAHGKMPPSDMDDRVLGFAEGQGDVLLATNIIENGLDVPRANTILIWRADRFGIAQLHQLRGRVGRGNRRGVAYLLTEPGASLTPATQKRLAALQFLDRLGSGFVISERDMDLRGAGDLLGEEQAGHVKLIGADLYRHVLEGALQSARGETPEEDWSPELHLDVPARIPEEYVPEPEVRLNLYVRLARMRALADIDAFADELDDRFGPLPLPTENLLKLALIGSLCRRAGVGRVDAGERAIALAFCADPGAATLKRLAAASQGEWQWNGERLICSRPTEAGQRCAIVADLLEDIVAADPLSKK